MKAPILVTGSHRSGSTWVGRMLAAASGVGYIHEPFHPLHRPGICGAEFPLWFTYVSQGNDGMIGHHIGRMLAFRYNLAGELAALRTPRDIARLGRDLGRFTWHRFRNSRPLVKDPIALFSTEWLATTFGMRVVILVRHPAAFASSIKRLNWKHPFDHFLAQRELMDGHLDSFAGEITRFAKQEQDIIEQACLLWRLTHFMIGGFQDRHPEWIVRRHEDLSVDAATAFRGLFEALDLEFTEGAQRTIKRFSDSGNPKEAPSGRASLRRDSEANIYNWRKRLSAEEIRLVRARVGELADRFYGERDWW